MVLADDESPDTAKLTPMIVGWQALERDDDDNC